MPVIMFSRVDFAAARFADDADEFACVDLQVDAVQGMKITDGGLVIFVDIAQVDHRVIGCGVCCFLKECHVCAFPAVRRSYLGGRVNRDQESSLLLLNCQ